MERASVPGMAVGRASMPAIRVAAGPGTGPAGAAPRVSQSPLRDDSRARRPALLGAGLLLALQIALSTPTLAQDAADAIDDTDAEFVVVRAARVITVSGDEIPDGVIVIVDGKIRSVGRDLEFPVNSTVIDASDLTVMPGLIGPFTRVGLPNYTRAGVHGDLAVADEYVPDEETLRLLREAGFTAVAFYPDGAGVPGRAMVTRTGGPEESRTLLSPGYLWVTNDKKTFRDALKKAQEEIEKVEKARKDFEEKQAKEKQQAEQQKKQGEQTGKPAEQEAPKPAPATQPATQPTTQPAFEPPKIDPAYQALADLIQKKEGVFALIDIRSASDLVHMWDVLEEFEIAHKFVIRAFVQSDLWRVMDQLAERKPAVVVQPYLNYVMWSAERIHVVRMLSEAGCEVSVTPFFDNAREFDVIRIRVADLVKDGWPRADALKSLTLYPARLLGLADRIGSIEKGRDADLLMLDGDPLDPFARVRKVMIAGEIVHDDGEDIR